MNTAVSTPAASTPSEPSGFLNDVLGAGAEAAAPGAASGSASAPVLDLQADGEVTGAEGSLDLEDVSPEIDGPEVKATSDFVVDFLGAPKKSGKKTYIKGSREAADLLFGVAFYYPAQQAAPAEDAPKKRGRKSNASKTLAGSSGKDQPYLKLSYYDDVANKAADFVDSLRERTKETTVELHTRNDDGDIVETFILSECKIIPMPTYLELFKNEDGKPRKLVVGLEFKSATRVSVDPDAEDEAEDAE